MYLGMGDHRPKGWEATRGRPLWEQELWRGPELYSVHGRRAMGVVTTNMAAPDENHVTDVSWLRNMLSASFTKVSDIFRDIDANGDGLIGIQEFRQVCLDDLGLAKMGVTAAAVDKLFEELDTSGDGLIEFAELHRVLRGGATIALDPAPRAMKRVYTGTRPNWSCRKVNGASGVMLHVSSDSKLVRRRGGRTPKLVSSSASAARLALPPVPSALLNEGDGGSPTTGPSRSTDEVVRDLLKTPTASYRARAEEMRSSRRALGAHAPLIPDDHKRITSAGGVWWTKGNLSVFPDRVLGANPCSSSVALGDTAGGTEPSSPMPASPMRRSGAGSLYERNSSPQSRVRSKPAAPPQTTPDEFEGAKFFGAFPFFNETTRIIPNVGILYERE